MKTQETKEKFEGIFNVKFLKDNYASIKTKSTKAKILEIKQENKKIHSTAFFSNNIENFNGASITLENSLGKEKTYFPGITSATDYKNLEGAEIDYFEKKWSTKIEGTSIDYTLKVLSGPLEGQIIKGHTFA